MSIHDDEEELQTHGEIEHAADCEAQAESECAAAESEGEKRPSALAPNEHWDTQTKCSDTVPTAPRVKYIGLSRLYNLGNYENIKFDVGVDVPEGQSAAETMVMLLKIMQQLRPIKRDYNVERALKNLSIPETELNEHQKAELPELQALLDAHQTRVRQRKAAIQKLDHLGGSATTKDAKDSWEDVDDYDEN